MHTSKTMSRPTVCVCVRACVQACTMLAAARGQLQHNPLTIQSSYSLLHISLDKQNVQLVSIN